MLPVSHVEAAWLRDVVLPEAAPRVVVAGAYEGATVAFIREHHPSALILAYEPQDFAYAKLVARFKDDAHVTVVNYALGAVPVRTEVTLYEYGTDAASVVPLPTSRAQCDIWLLPAVDHLRYSGWAYTDLFVCNMEGYEYSLIPHLLRSYQVYVSKFLIQWHFLDRMEVQYRRVAGLLEDFGYKGGTLGAGWEVWVR